MQKVLLKDKVKLTDLTNLVFFAGDTVLLALSAADIDPEVNHTYLNKYFYQRNYLKPLAPLAVEDIGEFTGAGAAMEIHTFTAIMCEPFKDKWVRLYKMLVESEYDPIANVDANETFTTTTAHGHTVTNTGTQGMQHGESISHTGTEQLSHGESISHTGTEQLSHGESISHTGTEKNEHGESIDRTGTQTNESGVYGFNSASAVDSNTDTRTDNLTEAHTGTDTRTDNLTEAHTGNDTRTDNLTEAHTGNDTRTDNLTEAHTGTDTRTDNLTETHGGTDTVTETRRRKGNIGVTMTQQMMNAEIEVRKKIFWDLAFEDIEKVLFINIY